MGDVNYRRGNVEKCMMKVGEGTESLLELSNEAHQKNS